MFPVDWRLTADLFQKTLAAESDHDQAIAPAPAERDEAWSTLTALRRRAGAIVIDLGERLQGTARPGDLCPPPRPTHPIR